MLPVLPSLWRGVREVVDSSRRRGRACVSRPRFYRLAALVAMRPRRVAGHAHGGRADRPASLRSGVHRAGREHIGAVTGPEQRAPSETDPLRNDGRGVHAFRGAAPGWAGWHETVAAKRPTSHGVGRNPEQTDAKSEKPGTNGAAQTIGICCKYAECERQGSTTYNRGVLVRGSRRPQRVRGRGACPPKHPAASTTFSAAE